MDVEEFGVACQARAETGVGAYSFPQLALTEPANDKVVTTVTTPLPGPRQAVLASTPPFSSPMPVGLDESGSFPLAVLVEKRAKEQLDDVTLLRS